MYYGSAALGAIELRRVRENGGLNETFEIDLESENINEWIVDMLHRHMHLLTEEFAMTWLLEGRPRELSGEMVVTLKVKDMTCLYEDSCS